MFSTAAPAASELAAPNLAASDIQLVIFDCDGVLVDSENISNRVLAEVLTECGLPTTPDQAVAEYKGRILADVTARAEQRLGATLPSGWIDRFELARADAFRAELQVIPGAAAAVKAVTAAGINACVASQGKPEKTQLTLGITGLRDLFGPTAIFTAYEVPRGKPHPDLFLHAAKSMGAEPSRAVVIEDTPLGVQAAVAAKMRVFGFTADSDAVILEAAGATTFKSMHEVPNLLNLPSA